jgi:hypothetical protein
MPMITHFYVVTDAGTSIYSKSTEKQAEQHLLPGFMTAMDSFAKKTLSGELESVSIGNSMYFVASAHKLLFITRTELNAKGSVVKKELEELQNIFFSNFPPQVYSENWEALKDATRTLDAAYDRFFKDSDQKMREAVW